MTGTATSTYSPDALASLRDSYALHLDATKAAKTSVIYLGALDSLMGHLEATGMPTGARSIRREHVESWMAARRAQVKPASRSLQYRALVQFFKWAVEEEEIERSPMEKIKPPRVPETPVPVVAAVDFRALLRACEGKGYNERRDAAILLFLYDSGVRLGELVGLKVGDVDLRDRLAYVTGKRSDMRAVRFGAKAAVAVDRYLRLRRGHRAADDEALWLGQDGPLSDSGVAQIIARRCREAGLDRIHAHQFRHTFAHEWRVNGGDPNDLMRLAGWRSPQMLARYGASAADSRARAAYKSPADRL
jgi:site-specific recombinase XerD